MLAGPGGSLVEYDLDDTGALVPVDRPPRPEQGRHHRRRRHHADRRCTPRASPGCVLCGDPTKALGAVAEPECARIIAALDLAERMQVPVEWFALSAGARISMDSGTENMDWVAKALQADRRVHPGRRRDQRRRRRASTSAPSRTGTPRRRC